MVLKIGSITIENLFSYGKEDNYFDFNDIDIGLVLGRKGNDLSLSNGTGKSSIFNSILYAIYGRLLDGKVYDSIVRPGCLEGKVVLTLLVDDKEMTIIRARSVKHQQTKLELYMDSQCLTGETIAETEEKIKSILKIDFSVFRNSIYFGQQDFGNFCAVGDAGRREVFTEVLRLHILDKAFEETKKYLNGLNADREKMEHERKWIIEESKQYGDIESIESDLSRRIEEKELVSAKKRELDNSMLELVGELGALEEKRLVLAKEFEAYSNCEKEIETYKNKIAMEEKDYNKSQTKLAAELGEITLEENRLKKLIGTVGSENLSKGLADLDEQEKEASGLLQEVKKEKTEHEKAKFVQECQKKELEKKIVEAERLKEACPLFPEKKCPLVTEGDMKRLVAECNQKLEEIGASINVECKVLEEMETLEEELEQKVASLVEEKKVIQEQLLSIEKLEKLAKERERIQECRDSLNKAHRKEIERLEEECVKRVEGLERVKQSEKIRKQLEEKINDVMWEKKSLQVALEGENEKLEEINKNLSFLEEAKRKIEMYSQRLKEIDKKLNEIDVQIRKYTVLGQAFGQRGMKSCIIEDVVGIFECKANEYLRQLFDYPVNISFVTQVPKKKSGELMEKFEILIRDGEITKNYDCFSPGERRRFDLAVRLALVQLVQYSCGVQPKFLIFDEAMDNLDENGKNRFIQLLESLRKEVKTIVLISHDPSFQDYFRNVIFVEKDRGISKFIKS